MKDYKVAEDLLRTTLEMYEQGFVQANPDLTISFPTTITYHKVDKFGKNDDVAYLRIERRIKPKDAPDEEAESIMIHQDAYKFKNVQDRINPDAPWKADLYFNAIRRLIAAGLEYAELIRRMEMTKKTSTTPDGKVISSNEPDIMITDQMPAPLTEDELKYKQWVNKHNEQALKNQGRL